MLPDYPLKASVDQGINLTDVDKIAIGLGSQSKGGGGWWFRHDVL